MRIAATWACLFPAARTQETLISNVPSSFNPLLLSLIDVIGPQDGGSKLILAGDADVPFASLQY